MRTFEVVWKLYGKREIADGVLKIVGLVANSNRMTNPSYTNFINGDLAVIGGILDVNKWLRTHGNCRRLGAASPTPNDGALLRF